MAALLNLASRDEVKAWVRSNAGVLLRSGGGLDKAVYQEMQTALRPLTPYPPLNTVLILPDCDEEIMGGMFKGFEELAKAGGILRVPCSSPALPYSSRTPHPLSCHSVLDPAGGRHVVPDGIMKHRHPGKCSISPCAS